MVVLAEEVASCLGGQALPCSSTVPQLAPTLCWLASESRERPCTESFRAAEGDLEESRQLQGVSRVWPRIEELATNIAGPLWPR